MKYDYHQTDLSKCVLGGLFAGIIAAFANLIFVFIYRGITEFYVVSGLDVTVIVFGSLLQLLTIGIVFYFFIYYLKKGMPVYRVMVVLVTAAILYFGLIVRGSVMGDAPVQFRIMITVTQIIVGLLAEFLIPYLFKHDRLIS